MRPMRVTAILLPCVSTRLICSRIFSLLKIVSGSQSSNRFSAVAALENKSPARRDECELPFQRFDFPGGDKRWVPCQSAASSNRPIGLGLYNAAVGRRTWFARIEGSR